ncbi:MULTISPECIES: SDR family NAD(P)-dependent oxidoreductase [Klebsiella]|uniref:Short-chain dehydrogenase/reductase SDR n=1 Tax=Klebsiella variicola TaxID=244366 RepID=A0ABD7PCW1_KLEVA|nr:SDR family oxidoreductase [Klebsiella variicola]MCD9672781.1 SDR family oxidoreductase [Klebsiella variicola subsp. variicola]MCK6050140.1 SDR family oxidoreductase [Klebsiella variicola]PXL43356.1 oxidoreductase [Klebsiella variicola]SXF98532.1 short-chain dehydrogenase/reductase SDR [Klebsiella variicola]
MRHAVITGFSSGIGEAIAHRLLEKGWRVTGLSRSKGNIESPYLTFIPVDLTDSNALAEALCTISSPDALIHAAGMMVAAPAGELDIALSARLWALHVHAAEILVNHFVSQLQEGARIVVIGSRTSRGAANRSQYVATKAALVGVVRSWAQELAPRGITVNVVAPGATETPMLSQPGRAASTPVVPPIGRLIKPEEVASLVEYLLTPEAAPITGQELVICGGASLKS